MQGHAQFLTGIIHQRLALRRRLTNAGGCQQRADDALLSISIGNRWRTLHPPQRMAVRRRNGRYWFTSLTSITAKQDSGNEIWDMYLDEVKEDDRRIADGWKEDSNGILVFVSPNPLIIPLIVSMTTDKLQDRSFLRNCWLLYH